MIVTRTVGWFAIASALVLVGCSDDGGGGGGSGGTTPATGGTGGSVTDYAPQSVEGKSITFTEVGGPSNKWIFGAETAQLEGVDTFPYTFEKDAVNHTVIVFDVQGSDQYDMTWESATTGSCQESFDGAPGNPCTFVME